MSNLAGLENRDIVEKPSEADKVDDVIEEHTEEESPLEMSVGDDNVDEANAGDTGGSDNDSLAESVEQDQFSPGRQVEEVLDPETGEMNEVSVIETEETDGIFSDGPKSSDYPVLRDLFNEEGLGSTKDKRDRDGSGSDDDGIVSKQLKLSQHDSDSAQQAGEVFVDPSQGGGGKGHVREGVGMENSLGNEGEEDGHVGELDVELPAD